MIIRFQDSNLMPLAASVVVLLYAAGVLMRQSTLWYEWAGAVLGVGAMAAFWIWDYRRRRRQTGDR